MASTGYWENTPEVIRYLCSSARAVNFWAWVAGTLSFSNNLKDCYIFKNIQSRKITVNSS